MAKVYVSGKITGLEDYEKHFNDAEKKLKLLGHKVMNPAALAKGFEWDDYMPICFAMINACDMVYMLPNWEDSKGAKLEKHYAESMGKRIKYNYFNTVGPQEYAKAMARVSESTIGNQKYPKSKEAVVVGSIPDDNIFVKDFGEFVINPVTWFVGDEFNELNILDEVRIYREITKHETAIKELKETLKL